MMELNQWEQQLVDTFNAMIPQIIANDSLINFNLVQQACAKQLLKAAYRTKSNPRTWVCTTFGKDRHWLHKKNF